MKKRLGKPGSVRVSRKPKSAIGRKGSGREATLLVALSAGALKRIKADLSELGITTAAARTDFFRGAIFAGIANGRLARHPRWDTLIRQIQPVVQKHLGVGVSYDGAKGILELGRGNR